MKKLSIGEVNNIVKECGYTLLSKEYINYDTKLQVLCPLKHNITISLGNIKRNKCKGCMRVKTSERFSLGIDVVWKTALDFGFTLKNKEYKNNSTNLDLICVKCNYLWITPFHNLKKYKICPKCANRTVKNIFLYDLKDIALKNNIVILNNNTDNEKISAKQKFSVSCNKCDNVWKTTWDNISRGIGCGTCAIKRNADKLRYSMDEVRDIVKNAGGKLLSKTYTIKDEKLKILCNACNNIFYPTLGNITSNHWCPICGHIKSAKKQRRSSILYHWKTNEEVVCVGSYEKAVVEYLNKNKIGFRWQHKTFTTNIVTKFGHKQTYRPDLYLIGQKKWVEIKGYMRDDSKKKWNWFHKKHTNSELWDKLKLKEMGIL